MQSALGNQSLCILAQSEEAETSAILNPSSRCVIPQVSVRQNPDDPLCHRTHGMTGFTAS